MLYVKINVGIFVDRMAKFDREAMKKSRLQTTTLKSTGQPKFALEEEVKINIFSVFSPIIKNDVKNSSTFTSVYRLINSYMFSVLIQCIRKKTRSQTGALIN